MISLNDNNIFVGEIKQFLKTFNLPNCLVGDYREKSYVNHIYLYNGNLYCNYYEDNSTTIITKTLSTYIYGSNYLNVTSNLKLNNLLYDRDTHRYLGKYLRFIRDYKKIDLMSMYNLFDGDVYSKDVTLKDSSSSITLKTGNGYVLYSVPVHFGCTYTIKTDSKFAVECGVMFNNYKNDSFNNISYYKKSNKSMFVYRNLKEYDISNLPNDDNLRLIIKVPSETSIITILEGEYDSEGFNVKPQLLSYVNNKNYLLADRFIEYLTNNVITGMSEQYDVHKLDVLMMKNNLMDSKYAGIWNSNDRTAIKKYIMNNIYGDNEEHRCNNYDMLGYCDSEVEKSMTKYDGGLV